jgi:hypothetical protein
VAVVPALWLSKGHNSKLYNMESRYTVAAFFVDLLWEFCMKRMKRLYRSIYHPVYILVFILMGMFMFLSFILFRSFWHDIQTGGEIQWGATFFVPVVFMSYWLYVIFLFCKKLRRIVIHDNLIKVGKRKIDLNDVIEVVYTRQSFKVLFASQQQQVIIIKLINDEEIFIWKDHYWNGKKIKPILTTILSSKK